MPSRFSLPSFARVSAPLALAVLIAVSPFVAFAAPGGSGRPAGDGSGTAPTAALVSAALAVGQNVSQKAEPKAQQGSGDVSLRAAVARDSEVIKDLVYSADGRPPAAQRQAYELSLIDAVELALRNNLNVQIARYSPQSAFEGINGQRGAFDPSLSFTIPQSFSRGTSPTTNQTAGGDIITQQGVSGGFSWAETLEWGTSYSLNWGSNRTSSNNEFSTFNPSFGSNLSGQITQPLLRGFGDVNRTGLRVAMNSYEGSLEQFRGQVQGTIAQVVGAYWNLRGQAEAVLVNEQTLRLSEQQLARNRIQVEIGTLAPIETVQAETSVAGNQLNLIRALNNLENAQDALKEFINFDVVVDDPFAYELVATEELEQAVPPIDVEEAVRIALDNDPGLASQRIGLRSAELNLADAKNSLLPSLSVTASFNLQGRGGTRILREGGIGGQELEIIETGFSNSISQVFSGDFNTWRVGATLTMPLHNYSAKAGAARSQIDQRQRLTELEQSQQQISYAVRAQVRNVENLVQQLQTSTLRRELAERQLRAEERKFEVGTSTNFQVLTFQNDFSAAQLSELQDVISLQNAIAQLEEAKGTLLQYFGVQIGDAGTGGGR